MLTRRSEHPGLLNEYSSMEYLVGLGEPEVAWSAGRSKFEVDRSGNAAEENQKLRGAR